MRSILQMCVFVLMPAGRSGMVKGWDGCWEACFTRRITSGPLTNTLQRNSQSNAVSGKTVALRRRWVISQLGKGNWFPAEVFHITPLMMNRVWHNRKAGHGIFCVKQWSIIHTCFPRYQSMSAQRQIPTWRNISEDLLHHITKVGLFLLWCVDCLSLVGYINTSRFCMFKKNTWALTWEMPRWTEVIGFTEGFDEHRIDVNHMLGFTASWCQSNWTQSIKWCAAPTSSDQRNFGRMLFIPPVKWCDSIMQKCLLILIFPVAWQPGQDVFLPLE